MKNVRLVVVLGLVTAVTLFGDIRPARAGFCIAGLIGDCSGPTLNANANANVNAKLVVDGTQIATILQQVDRANAGLLDSANAALARGLSTENHAIAQGVHDETQQISDAIRSQLQQLATSSTDVVNQVADRVDLQLAALLKQASGLAASLNQAVVSLEAKISAQINQQIAATLSGIRQQIQQIHADVMDILGNVEEFLHGAVNQLYARSQDVAQTTHVQAVADTSQLVVLGARSALALGLLVLVWIGARLGSDYANKRRTGPPVELIAAGVLFVGGATLLADRALLPATLGVSLDPPALPDICSQAEREYTAFEGHVEQHADSESLRLEGGDLEEDLNHCAYSTLSKERAEDAQERIASVVAALRPPQQTVAKK
jgi:hypothetical protein